MPPSLPRLSRSGPPAPPLTSQQSTEGEREGGGREKQTIAPREPRKDPQNNEYRSLFTGFTGFEKREDIIVQGMGRGWRRFR
eukprot:scaffold130438_cov26-Tisochrysis_lutea.AAC.2